jgi:hypothetical protein
VRAVARTRPVARVRGRSLVAIAGAMALAGGGAPVAAAQGTDVGGSVPSYMGLGIDPVEGFATFPAGPGSHELTIDARVTLTTGRATLSVADGDAAAGRRLGRMASRVAVLRRPLQATVGSSAFRPLSLPIEPPLEEFLEPVANAPATVRLRQRIAAGERPRGTFDKTVLITLSSNAP